MPDPISSENRSFYDPAAFDTSGGDPSTASCAATATPPSPSAHTITLGPVYVTGDLGAGGKELVRRHDSSPPPCSSEQANAYISCGLAASAAGTTLATSPTAIGLVLGAMTTAGLASQCSRDVLARLACHEQSTRLAELDVECASRDGVLLQGAAGNPVCLVTK